MGTNFILILCKFRNDKGTIYFYKYIEFLKRAEYDLFI